MLRIKIESLEKRLELIEIIVKLLAARTESQRAVEVAWTPSAEIERREFRREPRPIRKEESVKLSSSASERRERAEIPRSPPAEVVRRVSVEKSQKVSLELIEEIAEGNPWAEVLSRKKGGRS